VDETATGSANSFGPIVPTSKRRCLADRGIGRLWLEARSRAQSDFAIPGCGT